jgi:hypothetical protein
MISGCERHTERVDERPPGELEVVRIGREALRPFGERTGDGLQYDRSSAKSTLGEALLIAVMAPCFAAIGSNRKGQGLG